MIYRRAMQDDTGGEVERPFDLEIAIALSLPPDEFQVWLDSLDEDPPPPSAYPLHTDEGRRGFLEAYIWRGEALFESVNHIWKLLYPPKAQRCTLMGLAAGTGGTGKMALVHLLRRALRESLDNDLVQPGSNGEYYASIDEFHEASMAFFAADRAHYQKAIQKYADILNGGPEDAPHEALVIQGPWTAPFTSHPPERENTNPRST
jgi:hypothetical protein